MKLLLSNNVVDPDSTDRFGRSPLLAAATAGHVPLVRLLVATISVDPGSEDMFGRTALTEARRRGHSEITRLLQKEHDETGAIPHNADSSMIKQSAVHRGRIFCDICLLNISDIDRHYHCQICRNGDFDLRQECVARGAFSLNENHKLSERVMNMVS